MVVWSGRMADRLGDQEIPQLMTLGGHAQLPYKLTRDHVLINEVSRGPVSLSCGTETIWSGQCEILSCTVVSFSVFRAPGDDSRSLLRLFIATITQLWQCLQFRQVSGFFHDPGASMYNVEAPPSHSRSSSPSHSMWALHSLMLYGRINALVASQKRKHPPRNIGCISSAEEIIPKAFREGLMVPESPVWNCASLVVGRESVPVCQCGP